MAELSQEKYAGKNLCWAVHFTLSLPGQVKDRCFRCYVLAAYLEK